MQLYLQLQSSHLYTCTLTCANICIHIHTHTHTQWGGGRGVDNLTVLKDLTEGLQGFINSCFICSLGEWTGV